MTNPVLDKITFYDEIDGQTKKAVHILAAHNMSEAVEQLEGWYGECIEKMHLTIYEEGPITMPVDMYKTLDKILSGNEVVE